MAGKAPDECIFVYLFYIGVHKKKCNHMATLYPKECICYIWNSAYGVISLQWKVYSMHLNILNALFTTLKYPFSPFYYLEINRESNSRKQRRCVVIWKKQNAPASIFAKILQNLEKSLYLDCQNCNYSPRPYQNPLRN